MSERECFLEYLILLAMSEAAEKTQILQQQSVVERIAIFGLIMASVLSKISLIVSIILFILVIASMIVLHLIDF